jgi:hypothetical protein
MTRHLEYYDLRRPSDTDYMIHVVREEILSSGKKLQGVQFYDPPFI